MTRGSGLSQSATMYIYAHRAELVEHLPDPEYRWRWVECDLSQGTKQRLRDAGLIRRAETVDGYWRTTRRMWRYVEGRSWWPADGSGGAEVGVGGGLTGVEWELDPADTEQATITEALAQ